MYGIVRTSAETMKSHTQGEIQKSRAPDFERFLLLFMYLIFSFNYSIVPVKYYFIVLVDERYSVIQINTIIYLH